ncbi:hypothetical protein ACLK19_13905 [Escherichia coli]
MIYQRDSHHQFNQYHPLDARRLVVRSESTVTFTDFGRLSASCGSICPDAVGGGDNA